LMLGLIELARHPDGSFWIVVRVFAEQMAVGLAVGVAGGAVAAYLVQRVTRAAALLPLTLAAATFGVAALAHGSGFLAVFVAGLVRGDAEALRQAELVSLRKRLATIAEVVVFVALGLTVHISDIAIGRWAEGLLVAAFLALVARTAVCGALLARVRLGAGERLFVIWGGLKGAVPILLAAYALAAHVHGGERIYETVFVVVLASVVLQGSTIPYVARRLGVEQSQV
jgi:cell volume regulation protein A